MATGSSQLRTARNLFSKFGAGLAPPIVRVEAESNPYIRWGNGSGLGPGSLPHWDVSENATYFEPESSRLCVDDLLKPMVAGLRLNQINIVLEVLHKYDRGPASLWRRPIG